MTETIILVVGLLIGSFVTFICVTVNKKDDANITNNAIPPAIKEYSIISVPTRCGTALQHYNYSRPITKEEYDEATKTNRKPPPTIIMPGG